MFTLTGFADEISGDFVEQLECITALGMHHLDLRNVFGKNVLAITDQEAEQVQAMLRQYRCSISCIASPIGKYAIQDDFGPQLKAMARAVELAILFDTPYIRIFSYYIPAGESPADYRDEVMSRMRRLTELAERNGRTLVLENDSGGLYGDVAERVRDIVQTVDSPSLRLALDPGNFVMERVMPFSQAYPMLSPYVGYLHIKDADSTLRRFVPAGAGQGEISLILEAFKSSSRSYYLSVEPHLHHAFPEASDKERFEIAAKALQALLAELSIEWN